ncbi:ArsR/SmtB family transcription factor [Calorimonas adulescens]|uniref:Winged helix-turn-helix transcriptional regulator n=1 Tax=Calorimonas adulescens TaxID=2606906 RepID=A0A5D8QBJ8_9THEO|nr:winged helix-turn-helix transcriptional regulator [Calorimonas adulescens]
MTNRLLTQQANLFKALSDEFRLRILFYLYLNGEKCVCDICDFFNTGQSNISYHLKLLCDANIINKRQVAVWNYYSLNTENKLYPYLYEIFKNLSQE